ncbi:hypothetical protein Tco_0664621 [Tanacetum coccineum]
MINTVSKHKVFSTMCILSIVSVHVEKKSEYGYLKEIVVRRADQKLYKFKEGDFPDLHLNDIKDMLFTRGIVLKNKVEDVQLGVESYQRKLNLTKPQRTCQHISVKEPYTLNYDPPGIIYEDKRKKKRLMRADEIYKFCMPLREWTEKDKRRTCIMVNKIDELLLKRRILSSLEVLVGARKTETDKQLLQRTV